MSTINIYEARSITNAVNKIKTINPFVMDLLFSKKRFHAADSFDKEIRKRGAKLAQFVNETEDARGIGKSKSKVDTITIPRTFEEKVWTAKELADVQALLTSNYMSIAQREKLADEHVGMEILDLKNRVINRREQMACSILNTGKISVAQDNVEFEYDFGLVNDTLANGGHLISNAAADNKWNGGSAVDIIGDLREWKRAIARRSGMSADVCILGESAADAFIKDTNVQKMLDNNNLRVGRLDLNNDQIEGGTYIGRFLGIDFYEYTQEYSIDDTTTANLIDPNKAILIATKVPSMLHYGPIYRIDDVAKKQKIYNVEYLLEADVINKTSLSWKLEQKSIPVIDDPDAIISATVIA